MRKKEAFKVRFQAHFNQLVLYYVTHIYAPLDGLSWERLPVPPEQGSGGDSKEAGWDLEMPVALRTDNEELLQ